MAETWRVVLASGEVREVLVHRDDSDSRYSDSRYRWCAGGLRGRTPRSAIVSSLALADVDVAEILAPGELTRAELRAQAWCEGAEAMREALRAALWQSLSAEQIDALRALPVPPCPEVSR